MRSRLGRPLGHDDLNPGRKLGAVFGTEELIVAAVCGLLLLRTGLGPLQWCLAAAFYGIFMHPDVIYGITPADLGRVGIAAAQPTVSTYTVAIAVILLIAFAVPQATTRWRPVVPIVGFAVLWSLLCWPRTGEVHAGVLHLAVGAASWAAGTAVSALVRSKPSGHRVMSIWVLGWAAFEAALSVLQFAGASLFTNPGAVDTDPTLAGRVGGTLGHPSTIGKVVFLLMFVTLPWLASTDRSLRRRAVAAMLVMTVPLVLSGGRANALAALSIAILAMVMDPGPRRWSRRVRLAAVIGVTALLSADLWLHRTVTGDDGRTRAHLSNVAFNYLHTHWNWFTGTGVNTYVTAVGPTDWLTAAGWPVHDLYVLAAVELGAIGAVLFLVPVAYSVLCGLRGRSRPTIEGAQARVLIAGVPGLLLITLTGWGMMSETLMAWMFVLGYCTQEVGLTRPVQIRQPPRALHRFPATADLGARRSMHDTASMSPG
jgi:hypothetical protein